MRTKDYELLNDLEDSFWWFEGMREITATLLDPFCVPESRSRLVLDAGCGTGGNLTWLKRYAGEKNVVGIDLAEEAVAYSSAGINNSVARASTTFLPFRDSVFDLVTSYEVLGQLPAGEDEKALREICRVLRPGGFAFIRVAAYEWMRSSHDSALLTTTRYTMPRLVDLTRGAGLRAVRTTYANTILLPVVALRRLVLQRVGLAASGSDVKPFPPELAWLNRLLTRALLQESRWLEKSNAALPAGLSAICIAQKPDAIAA